MVRPLWRIIATVPAVLAVRLDDDDAAVKPTAAEEQLETMEEIAEKKMQETKDRAVGQANATAHAAHEQAHLAAEKIEKAAAVTAAATDEEAAAHEAETKNKVKATENKAKADIQGLKQQFVEEVGRLQSKKHDALVRTSIANQHIVEGEESVKKQETIRSEDEKEEEQVEMELKKARDEKFMEDSHFHTIQQALEHQVSERKASDESEQKTLEQRLKALEKGAFQHVDEVANEAAENVSAEVEHASERSQGLVQAAERANAIRLAEAKKVAKSSLLSFAQDTEEELQKAGQAAKASVVRARADADKSVRQARAAAAAGEAAVRERHAERDAQIVKRATRDADLALEDARRLKDTQEAKAKALEAAAGEQIRQINGLVNAQIQSVRQDAEQRMEAQRAKTSEEAHATETRAEMAIMKLEAAAAGSAAPSKSHVQ